MRGHQQSQVEEAVTRTGVDCKRRRERPPKPEGRRRKRWEQRGGGGGRGRRGEGGVLSSLSKSPLFFSSSFLREGALLSFQEVDIYIPRRLEPLARTLGTEGGGTRGAWAIVRYEDH